MGVEYAHFADITEHVQSIMTPRHMLRTFRSNPLERIAVTKTKANESQ